MPGGVMQKERKKRIMKRAVMKAILVIMLVCIAMITFLLLFQVRKIEVSGNQYLSRQEIADWVQDDEWSTNSLYLMIKYHLMDYEQFCKMKPTAIFINVGRGPIVDEKGLAKALKKEKIGAAGLDVLEVEPMDPENPLCKLSESDRLLITPHIAWAAVEARTRLLQEVYKNLKAFQKGEKRNVCTG